MRRGEITRTDAFFHPHRHILTRALGVDRQLDVDTWTLDVAEHDRILLCSDGLTNECADGEIVEILAANTDPGAAAQALVVRALEHGGSDNITVVVADVEGTVSRAGVPSGGKAAAGAAAAHLPGSRASGPRHGLCPAETPVPPPPASRRASRHALVGAVRARPRRGACRRGRFRRMVREGLVFRRVRAQQGRHLPRATGRVPVVQTDPRGDDVARRGAPSTRPACRS